MFLFIDTETTGRVNFERPASDECQPDMIELSAALFTENKRLVQAISTLVTCPRPEGWRIEPEAQSVHGITNEMCAEYGMPPYQCLAILNGMSIAARLTIAHNVRFDLAVIDTAVTRIGNLIGLRAVTDGPSYCTMKRSADICRIPFPDGTGHKWPKLEEAYQFFTGREFPNAHQGLYDVLACADLFFELRKDEREAEYINHVLEVK